MISYDRDIENAVIGSLMVWYEELREKIPLLEEGDFHFHGKLFAELLNLYRSGEGTLNAGVFVSRLASEELRENAKRCMSYAVSIHEVDGQIGRLQELSANRRISGKLQDLLFGGDIHPQDLQAILEDEAGRRSANEAEGKAMRNLDAFIAGVGVPKERVFTGFSTVDAVLGGLRKPSVCYIGARPSTGKTTLALNIAANQRGQKTLLFSLEMDSEMIFERMACAALDLNYADFTKQRLSPENAQRVRIDAGQLRVRRELFVLDDVYGIEGISAAAASVKPDLIIIDYIQKVTTARRFLTTRESIEYISGELKRIAKYGKCCVVCLSQVARDGKDEPTMSSLKEAGGLEADGDYILMLHRPYVQNKSNPSIRPEDATLLIDKNKFGNTGVIDLYFDGRRQRFSEVDHVHEREGRI